MFAETSRTLLHKPQSRYSPKFPRDMLDTLAKFIVDKKLESGMSLRLSRDMHACRRLSRKRDIRIPARLAWPLYDESS